MHSYMKRRSTSMSSTKASLHQQPESASNIAEEQPSKLTKTEGFNSTGECQENIDTGSHNIDICMKHARVKYETNPDLLPEVEQLPEYVPSAEDLDFNERLGSANSKVGNLIAEALAQLAAPCVAPAELTPAEEAEKAAAEEWARGYEKANEATEQMAEKSEILVRDVMGLVDELEASGIAVPRDTQLPSSLASPKRDVREELLASNQKATATDTGTQTEAKAAPTSLQRASSLKPQANESPDADSKLPKRRARSETAQKNQGWHTLWSCDYKVSW